MSHIHKQEAQILLMTHFSSVKQTYAMITSDESHKAITSHVGILGSSPVVMFESNCEMTIYTRYETGGNNTMQFKKNNNL